MIHYLLNDYWNETKAHSMKLFIISFTKVFSCTSVFKRFSQFAHQWPDDANPVLLDGFNVVLTGLENIPERHLWLPVLCTWSCPEPVSNVKNNWFKICSNAKTLIYFKQSWRMNWSDIISNKIRPKQHSGVQSSLTIGPWQLNNNR